MRKVLVLGGSGDIGRAISKIFANDNLVSVGSNDIDLSDSQSIKKFIKYNNNFDVIINSVGYNVLGEFESLTQEQIVRSVQINLLGFLPIIHSNIEYWKTTKTGKLVLISSLYGIFSRKSRTPYVISKHGLIGLMKTLAIELAEFGVMVNSVTPGYIDTKLTLRNNTAAMLHKLTKGIPVGRLGTAEEIAYAVEFLTNNKNTYINGHDLIVDGGFSIGGFQNL